MICFLRIHPIIIYTRSPAWEVFFACPQRQSFICIVTATLICHSFRATCTSGNSGNQRRLFSFYQEAYLYLVRYRLEEHCISRRDLLIFCGDEVVKIMEVLDPVAEFLIHASEVSVSWDEATEYLFYGLVTIAIWLIIKVFIEISEGKGKRKNSVLSNVDTRRRRSEGSIETNSGTSTREDGVCNRSTTKNGARVRFDLSKNEDYVIENVLAKRVFKVTAVSASELIGKLPEIAEDGGGKNGDKMGVDGVEKVVEKKSEELLGEIEEKDDEECRESDSDEVARRGVETIKITELEENVEIESKIKIIIEEVISEDSEYSPHIPPKMEEYEEVVGTTTHERETKELERIEPNEISDVGDEKRGDEIETSEQNILEEVGRKFVEEVLRDSAVAVLSGTHAKKVKEDEQTKANDDEEIADDGNGDVEGCGKEIEHVATSDRIEVKEVDENVKEELGHVSVKEMVERHQNGIAYSECSSQDVQEMNINVMEKEINNLKEPEDTDKIEIDVIQMEDMEDYSRTRKDDGQENIVEQSEGNSLGEGKVTKVEDTATETPHDVPQWYARVELMTNGGNARNASEFSMTKSLVKMFESLRESNYERTEYVPFKNKRIRRHLSMPFVGSTRYGGQFDRGATSRSEKGDKYDSDEDGDNTEEKNRENGPVEGADGETTSPNVSAKEWDEVDANKVPGCGVRVTRSRSLRDWKEDLKLSYKAGEWRLARGLPFYERFEDPDRERLIHETFGAILKPTICQREPVYDDVINRSYSAEEKNLLKNNCGQDGLKDWSCKFRLQDWNVVEDEEENTGFPKDREGKLAVEFNGNLSFFEATARNSRKEQEVDLISEGFSADFLDKERPEILVSEWVKVPEHCKSTYELRVKLLNKNKDSITEYRKDLSFDVSNKAKWEKVSHVFKGYDSGVRFILFNHGAVKWSGVSGCRMSGAVARVLNPT